MHCWAECGLQDRYQLNSSRVSGCGYRTYKCPLVCFNAPEKAMVCGGVQQTGV